MHRRSKFNPPIAIEKKVVFSERVRNEQIGLKHATYMKKTAFLFLLGSVFLAGCPEHEIIPAPTPKVELSAHFTGKINGTDTELTQNVSGYFLEATKAKIILPSPQPSSAVYYADFKSEQSLVSIKIAMGSIQWDASLASDPTLTQFNNFFAAALTPAYSAAAASGFEVVYRDGFGNVWKSDPASSPQDVIFTNVVQESDATGDYSKFTCSFNCTVYRTVGPDTFSLPIQNAVYSGWFKR